MDWFYFIIFEFILTTFSALLGVYVLWILRRRRDEFTVLLNKYGYIIGVCVAIIVSLVLLLFL